MVNSAKLSSVQLKNAARQMDLGIFFLEGKLCQQITEIFKISRNSLKL